MQSTGISVFVMLVCGLPSVGDELEWRKWCEVGRYVASADCHLPFYHHHYHYHFIYWNHFDECLMKRVMHDDTLVSPHFLERFGVDDFLSLVFLVLLVAATCGLAQLGPPACALMDLPECLFTQCVDPSSSLLFPFELVATVIIVQPVLSLGVTRSGFECCSANEVSGHREEELGFFFVLTAP